MAQKRPSENNTNRIPNLLAGLTSFATAVLTPIIAIYAYVTDSFGLNMIILLTIFSVTVILSTGYVLLLWKILRKESLPQQEKEEEDNEL